MNVQPGKDWKFFLFGQHTEALRDNLKRRGVRLTDDPDKADLIIPCGGDGTLFTAELRWPGRLKYPVRDSATAPLCPKHGLDTQLDAFFAGRLETTRLPKLVGRANGRELFAINDIFLHNQMPVTALRYSVSIDGAMYAREVVGDAVGAATIHGSTAYYRSITHSIFRTGIGLAFSNSTELVNHLVLPENSLIRIDILRGPAVMVADNSEETVLVEPGGFAELAMSDRYTDILGLDIFMCSECRRLRHTLRDSTRFLGGGNGGH